MIEDIFGNLPYDDYKGSIPKPGLDLDKAVDYLSANHLPLFLAVASILIGAII